MDKSPYPHHSNFKFFKQFIGVKDSYENGVQTIALERIIKNFNFDKKWIFRLGIDTPNNPQIRYSGDFFIS